MGSSIASPSTCFATLSKSDLRMQAALELLETDPDQTLTSVATHAGIPKSSLSRVHNNPERRQLYLYGEASDERIEDAIGDADVDSQSEIAELRTRIETLEEHF